MLQTAVNNVLAGSLLFASSYEGPASFQPSDLCSTWCISRNNCLSRNKYRVGETIAITAMARAGARTFRDASFAGLPFFVQKLMIFRTCGPREVLQLHTSTGTAGACPCVQVVTVGRVHRCQ